MNIENKKQFAIILLALGLGLFAAFLTGQYIKNSIEEQTTLLAQDYAQRTQQQEEQMAQQVAALKKQLSMEIQELAQKQEEAARKRTVKSQGDQMVRMEAFSVKTPKGKRALTILIDSLSAVGGLINAGDFVDVIAHLQIPDPYDKDEDAKEVTSILFQNIEVLAVNTNYDPVNQPPAYEEQQQARKLNVTLALEPEAAALLTFAQKNGKLQLSLRGPNEKETGAFEVASWDTLADFVFERQGTKLVVPANSSMLQSVGRTSTPDDVRPFVQIFKSGQEIKK